MQINICNIQSIILFTLFETNENTTRRLNFTDNQKQDNKVNINNQS